MTVADDNQLRVDALRGLCDAMLSDDPASDVQERLQSGRMLAAEMLGILNGPRPLPDHDNHHNAAVCPYCTDNGKHVLVDRDDLRRIVAYVEASGPWVDDTPVTRLLDKWKAL